MATFFQDASGNGNDWTATNINWTSSSDITYDIMSDVPTLTDEDTGNFATLNPLAGTKNTISDGNLKYSGSTGGDYHRPATLAASSGKWYFEVKATTLGGDFYAGISEISNNSNYDSVSVGNASNGSQYSMYSSIGGTYCSKVNNGFTTTNLVKAAAGDILQFAFDLDNNKFWFGINNTWADSGNPSTGANSLFTVTAGTYAPALTLSGGGVSTTLEANFGQRPFAYTPPTGYKKLNTYNLPDSAIKDGSKYFNATTYSGTSATNTITNSGSMQPDMLWIKSRSLGAGGNHMLVDSVRGVGTGTSTKEIYPNLTNAEASSNSVTSLNSNGFTLTAAAGDERYNKSGETYVGWQWRASNSTAVSNTDGTITSTVSANTTSGFSIVTHTSTGTTGTVGHGLGVTPKIVIEKTRSIVESWLVQTSIIDGTHDYLWLDLTSAKANMPWGSLPTNQVFSSYGHAAGTTKVAYCFAEVEGFSKFGTYTGNGSADGPFIYTGFRPAFLLYKRTDTTSYWVILDTKRNTYNFLENELYPNASLAEGTAGSNDRDVDFLVNGFKARGNHGDLNASGGTYIYMAFAESPFKNSLAR